MEFLSRHRNFFTACLLVLVVAGLGAKGFVYEPDELLVRRETLEAAEWKGPPLRIAMVSDIHVGSNYVNVAKVKEIVRLINAEQPDLVVLLGDYVTSGEDPAVLAQWAQAAPALQQLKSRLGTYAVLGNHDCWSHVVDIRESLTNAHVTVLENQSVKVPNAPLWLWGLADLWERKVDYSKPLQSIPEGAPIIALSHNPDAFPLISSRVPLTLAGHTHGGQVSLFGLRPIVPSDFGQKYAAGHVYEKERHLFVTTGVGTSMIPVRFGVPPEIVMLDLRPASAKSAER